MTELLARFRRSNKESRESIREPTTSEGLKTFKKFTKDQSYYTQSAILFTFRCENCRWFQPPGRCIQVTEEGPPSPGSINAKGSCSLWNGRGIRLSIYELVVGRGSDDKGLSNQRIRSRYMAFVRRRQKERIKGE
jgi:hypothetical protein